MIHWLSLSYMPTMLYLIIVSLIWALSFGLIKTHLAGLDPNLVSFLRLALSLIIFFPLLKIEKLTRALMFKFFFIGMIQYGLMYLTYIYSYQYLKAYQIALFTIFTPLYVTLINDFLTKKFHLLFLISALLAIIGTGIIVYKDIGTKDFQLGFILMQISNMCFAFGQVYYKHLMAKHTEIKDKNIFGLLYLGAVFITGAVCGVSSDWSTMHLNTAQILTLLYLGVIASGGCFFLWNYGAKLTNAGTLAVMNNLKIPLAIFFALVFFGESTDLLRLALGGGIVISALVLNKNRIFAKKTQPL